MQRERDRYAHLTRSLFKVAGLGSLIGSNKNKASTPPPSPTQRLSLRKVNVIPIKHSVREGLKRLRAVKAVRRRMLRMRRFLRPPRVSPRQIAPDEYKRWTDIRGRMLAAYQRNPAGKVTRPTASVRNALEATAVDFHRLGEVEGISRGFRRGMRTAGVLGGVTAAGTTVGAYKLGRHERRSRPTYGLPKYYYEYDVPEPVHKSLKGVGRGIKSIGRFYRRKLSPMDRKRLMSSMRAQMMAAKWGGQRSIG